MAEKSTRPRASKSDQDPFRKYEEWFVASPDPWQEIVKLEHGGDRTFASTVQAMVTNAEPAQRPGMETKLLTALGAPGLTEVGRMFVCRMLALIGTARSVPDLAALLGDPKSADAARYALDAIEDPAAVEASRGALDKLSGAAKAGLIGSLALRGDAGMIPVLRAIQASPTESAVVKTAAARGLERLAAKS